ncbi:MBL fold metallo-hydrolase [Tritonibacter horizontis]|uniref:Putative quorum-quenching lactonase YtnP n=1 Tax=Tritonibacter horizontis TaxID=1768241 RepID=A0A132BS55_9RHOB|nr:MBL fold metallo-hydrolase [Tritonibacter horizontis]KUP90637.1 putative quorum-quenching lactonase YtnP [Tritonibacter horizontis]
MTLNLTRRAALAGVAAAPLTAGLSSPLHAAGSGEAPKPLHARAFQVGDYTVHSLLAGSAARDGVQDIFGGGATDDAFAEVAAENFISDDKAQFYFTPTLVDTGSQKILFDTGLNAAGITQALADAGVTPDEIDVVVLTHMHGDHIGGMTTEAGAVTFANASYVTAAQEYDHWVGLPEGNGGADRVRANVAPQAEKMTFIEDGGSVASGITGMAAYGHTPGHMVYMIENGGQRLLLTADLANHYVFPFANPEWQTSFDTDKDAASASRRRVLEMLADSRTPMIGYHMPFPAAGFVETRGDGFRFVPVSYQMMG